MDIMRIKNIPSRLKLNLRNNVTRKDVRDINKPTNSGNSDVANKPHFSVILFDPSATWYWNRSINGYRLKQH